MRSKQRFRRKNLLAQRKQDATAPGSEEAEVPDTDESARQNVQQKAAQEFIGRQRQEAAFVFVSGVAPAERDLILHEGNEPVIGNGNAMGVGAEVAKNPDRGRRKAVCSRLPSAVHRVGGSNCRRVWVEPDREANHGTGVARKHAPAGAHLEICRGRAC